MDRIQVREPIEGDYLTYSCSRDECNRCNPGWNDMFAPRCTHDCHLVESK